MPAAPAFTSPLQIQLDLSHHSHQTQKHVTLPSHHVRTVTHSGRKGSNTMLTSTFNTLLRGQPNSILLSEACNSNGYLMSLSKLSSSISVPTKEEVVTTRKETSTETQKETKFPADYRLYIYNDPFNTRERVVDVLLKTCASLTFSRAYAAMQEAHETGRGLVLIIAQEIAEHYCACILSGLFIYFHIPYFQLSLSTSKRLLLSYITLLTSLTSLRLTMHTECNSWNFELGRTEQVNPLRIHSPIPPKHIHSYLILYPTASCIHRVHLMTSHVCFPRRSPNRNMAELINTTTHFSCVLHTKSCLHKLCRVGYVRCE